MRWKVWRVAASVALLLAAGGCGASGGGDLFWTSWGDDPTAGPTSAGSAAPEPADPSTSTTPSAPAMPDEWAWPAWLGESDLFEAAAITVVRGGDLEQVKEAFGAVGEPMRPWDDSISTPDEYFHVEPWAAFAAVPGGVVVVEPNGFVGTNPAVLERASSDALAVVVYWNIEFDTAVMVAENGAIVGDVYDPSVGGGRLHELAGALEIPPQPDPVEAIAWGLRAQPALTGIELTSGLWQQMSDEASAYQLEPPAWP